MLRHAISILCHLYAICEIEHQTQLQRHFTFPLFGAHNVVMTHHQKMIEAAAGSSSEQK